MSSVALPLHHTAHIHSVSKKIGGYFGGGGFSNIFPAPEYQKAAVSAYVKSLGNQYQGLYNKVRSLLYSDAVLRSHSAAERPRIPRRRGAGLALPHRRRPPLRARRRHLGQLADVW